MLFHLILYVWQLLEFICQSLEPARKNTINILYFSSSKNYQESTWVHISSDIGRSLKLRQRGATGCLGDAPTQQMVGRCRGGSLSPSPTSSPPLSSNYTERKSSLIGTNQPRNSPPWGEILSLAPWSCRAQSGSSSPSSPPPTPSSPPLHYVPL